MFIILIISNYKYKLFYISLTFLSGENCSCRDSIDIVLLCSFRYQYSGDLNFPVLFKCEILLKLTVVIIIIYYITIIIIVTVPLVIRSQYDTSRSLCSWSRSSVMLCISWVFYLSFPSGAVWDDICYFMPVHCVLLNVPLLSPLPPEDNRPYPSAHLLQRFSD